MVDDGASATVPSGAAVWALIGKATVRLPRRQQYHAAKPSGAAKRLLLFFGNGLVVPKTAAFGAML